jgi:hypothetical protein
LIAQQKLKLHPLSKIGQGVFCSLQVVKEAAYSAASFATSFATSFAVTAITAA